MPIRKLIICFLAMAAINAKSQALWPYVIPSTGWINYYSQTDGVESAPSAIDGNSNVYTTGYSGLSTSANLIVLKYDSTGTLQYSYSYNNGNSDYGTAIKVDGSGNAFIAGVSTGTTGSTLKDYVIIKLNSSGTSQWVKRYDKGVGKDDEATAIDVDGNGDVYVTGKSKNSSNNYDITTIKLNGSNGNTIWVHTYNGASSLDDVGKGLVLSNNGQYVYVTGSTNHSTQGWNIVTYALNASAGTVYWSPVVTNGTANGSDLSKGIILLGSNIAVCGELTNNTTGLDYTLIKYNGSTGGILWQSNYDVSNSSNKASDLVSDSTGNIGVVGLVYNGSTYDYHTVLFNPSGTQYAVNIEATGLSTPTVEPNIDNDTIAHHWYVCGEKQSTTRDIFAYQITPTGNTSWTKLFDGQSSNIDAGLGIMVNGIGDVYVAALSKNSMANYDYTTIKIGQTPVYAPIDLYNANEPPASYALYYKNSGQILYDNGSVASEVEFYTMNTSPQLFVRKNSVSFLNRWIDTLGNDSTDRIDMDFKYANTHSEIFFFDKQNDGYLNYFKTHCGGATGITDVKGSRRLMVPDIYKGIDLHYYSNKDGLKLYFVVKPSFSPNSIKLHFDGDISSSLNGSNELSVTSNLSSVKFKAPKIYNVLASLSGTNVTFTTTPITGTMGLISGNDYDFTIGTYNNAWPLVICLEQDDLELSSSSDCDWSTFWGGTGIDEATNVTTDASGNSYFIGQTDSPNFPSLSGGFLTTTTGKDAFLVKFNSSGGGVWGTFYGGNATVGANNAFPYGVGLNSSGEIYICGLTDNAGLPVVPSSAYGLQGGLDAFIARFNTSGNSVLFSRYIGSTGDDRAFDLTIDANDNVYIGGQAGGTSGLPLTNPGSGAFFQNSSSDDNDALIAKLNSSNSITWLTLFGGQNINAVIEESFQSIKALPNGNLLLAGVTNAPTRASANVSNPLCGVPLSNTDFPDCTPSGAYNQNYSSAFTNTEDNMIVELDASGALVWSTYYGGDGNEINAKIALIPGSSTDFYLYGNTSTKNGPLSLGLPGSYVQNYNSSSTIARGFVTRFHNRDNSWSWHTLIGEGTSAEVNGAVCDNSGNLYVCGKSFGGSGFGYTSGTTCAPVVLGSINSEFPKCHPSNMFNQSSYGGGTAGDAFLMAFLSNPQGGNPIHFGPFEMQWSTFYGGSGTDRGMALAFDASANKLVFVGTTKSAASGFPLLDPSNGNYQQNTNAGSSTSPLDPNGVQNQDCFVAKFCLNSMPVGLKENSKEAYGSGILYPNPNDGSFEISLNNSSADKYQYEIYDVLGKKMDQGTVSKDSNFKVNAAGKGLKNGIYFLNLKSEKTQYKFKFIVQ